MMKFNESREYFYILFFPVPLPLLLTSFSAASEKKEKKRRREINNPVGYRKYSRSSPSLSIESDRFTRERASA